jgi:hypothetical protein
MKIPVYKKERLNRLAVEIGNSYFNRDCLDFEFQTKVHHVSDIMSANEIPNKDCIDVEIADIESLFTDGFIPEMVTERYEDITVTFDRENEVIHSVNGDKWCLIDGRLEISKKGTVVRIIHLTSDEIEEIGKLTADFFKSIPCRRNALMEIEFYLEDNYL